MEAVRTNIIVNSPDYQGLDPASGELGIGGGVASGDGVLEPADVAALCLQAIRDDGAQIRAIQSDWTAVTPTAYRKAA